jgi:hypothetical protein
MAISRRFLSIMGIILVILYTCTLTGCVTTTEVVTPTDTTGGIGFNVLGSDGKPLGGVKVVSQTQPEGQLKVTGITTQSGDAVIFNGLKPGSYSFQFSRADYQDFTMNTNVNPGGAPVITVSMIPSGTAAPSPSPSAN